MLNFKCMNNKLRYLSTLSLISSTARLLPLVLVRWNVDDVLKTLPNNLDKSTKR